MNLVCLGKQKQMELPHVLCHFIALFEAHGYGVAWIHGCSGGRADCHCFDLTVVDKECSRRRRNVIFVGVVKRRNLTFSGCYSCLIDIFSNRNSFVGFFKVTGPFHED